MERQTLATSLAAIESHSASHSVERDAPPRARAFPLLLVSALTLFAVAIDGYHPCAEDGGLYMAGVKRLLDPTLYPHATAFVLEPMRHSLFAPTVAAAVRLTRLSLPIVLLALHLASIWLTLFAAWMLAARCWPSRTARAGAVVLLACWLALPIAGTALLFMDPYATARSLSTPAMVLALAGALEMTARGSPFNPQKRQRGLLLCAASLAVAAAMHPLMAAYALGATLMLLAVALAQSHSAALRNGSPRSLGAGACGLPASRRKARVRSHHPRRADAHLLVSRPVALVRAARTRRAPCNPHNLRVPQAGCPIHSALFAEWVGVIVSTYAPNRRRVPMTQAARWRAWLSPWAQPPASSLSSSPAPRPQPT